MLRTMAGVMMSMTTRIDAGAQSRALWLSTFAFTICFAVWTIFAIIGIQIKAELKLTETQFGLLVGTPILTGSLIRLILGIWSDQYGGRLVCMLTMLSAALMTALLTLAYDYPTFLLAALGVGDDEEDVGLRVAHTVMLPDSQPSTKLLMFGATRVNS